MVGVLDHLAIVARVKLEVRRGDTEDHAVPLVDDALGQIDDLRHVRAVLRVLLDRAGELLALGLELV